MLLHLLKIAPAEDNNEVLPVRPAMRETNANNPLLLLDDSEDDSDDIDERSAHIDGMLDDDGRDNDENRPNAGMDIADNNNGDNIDAAYDADGGEEDNASLQMTTPMPAKTKLDTTDAKTMTMRTEITMVAKTITTLAETTTTNPATTMLATTRMPMRSKTMTKQRTMAMLVRTGPTLTPRTRKRMRKERLIQMKTMQMSTLHTKKQKIWTS